MRRKYRFISLKNKIMVFFLLSILIPLSVMVVNAYFSSRQMLESKYSILLADVARQSNIRIEEYLRDIRQISLISSYGINSYISAVSQDNYPVQNYLRNQSIANEMQATQLLMNYITMKDRKISIYVYNMNPGNDLYISPNKPIDYAYEPRQEAWFNDFLESDDITRDLPTQKDRQVKGEGNWAIYNLRKILDMENGKLLGVMVISVDIEFIHELNKRMNVGSQSVMTIVDEQDRIMFRDDYGAIGQPFESIFPMGGHVDGGLDRQIVRVKGSEHMLIQAGFESHRWKTYLSMPMDDLTIEDGILKRNLWMIITVLLLFALVSTLYISSLITRPIKQLMRNMALVEHGKFDSLHPVQSNDEIGLMAIRFEQMSAELKQLVERIYEEQEQKVEAEIRALQAQINPHFLYNTLNSVKWIASMQRSDKIVEMTEALISMLRYTARADKGLVPVREELEHIRHYLVIQKVRYFNRIEVHVEVEDDSLLDQEIPKLSIQPLVENAIFHGIANQKDGVLTLEVRGIGKEQLRITVRDNGAGMSGEAASRLRERLAGSDAEGGIGICNVHQRIRRVFGEPYGVSFRSAEGEGAEFTLIFPYRPNEGGKRPC
ncbi:cache domain-containing sensor histidine kinase [Paenibacillus pasadenensis]|uniref:histidine kinase n=1 Tax=Paenibacillus pasadenensis TaxID=217090 RepID=A0A2N5N516_9BACL|nr:sensor histidine kinase [Paenibacillus pasadenensis]PLT45400.1 Autolysis histidine kinase LytS [Paenibacillus pasadenensis]